MDIKRAKQEIEHAVKAYLAVDDTGTPLIPPIRQRPILLMGPPGVGKTQIMEQIAQECGCLRSGGSDFHGAMKKGLDLACGYGDLQVPYTFLEAMDAELARRKNERHVIKTCKN